MALHTATLRIQGDHLRVDITCHAGPDAQCRQVATCDCEEYSLDKGVDGTWSHTVYRDPDCGDDCKGECNDKGPEEVEHLMQPGSSQCNYAVWMSEGRPEECYNGPDDVALNNTPIQFDWEYDHYEWKPVEQAGSE